MLPVSNSRRLFVNKFFGYSAGLGIGLNLLVDRLDWEKFSIPRLNLRFNELTETYSQDKVDQKVDYLEYWSDGENYYRQAKKFLSNHVFTTPIPKGNKVILGSYEHVSLDMFCKNYGAANCLGVEIHKYKEHSRCLFKDVREISPKTLGKVVVGWNNVSVWSGSPRSKLAGFNLLKKSLVKGGILIENPTPFIPKDISFNEFDLLYQDQFGSIWRKLT